MARADLRQFDYQKVGNIDAEMWQAYYNHQFFKLLFQLAQLIKNQLGLNWFLTLRLAYYSAWAAADYRINKKKGVNNERVLKNLTKFYGLISRHCVKPFNFQKTAELELAWWDIHRSSYENNPALEKSLAKAAATIYNINPESLKDYARYRAVAMILPRHQGGTQETPTDWQQINELLIKSWQSLHSAVQK